MPSGSHRSSGGSHRSGGSSSRSSGWSSSSSRSYDHGRSWGHRGYRRGGVVFHIPLKIGAGLGLCIVAAFISLIFGIIGTANKSSAQTMMNKIKEDYTYYQALIANAEKDSENKIVQAKVTDTFENAGKYYIIYKINIPGGGSLVGESYSVYTQSQAFELMDTTILVAVNTAHITLQTDSVPMDYKNMPLSRDAEYVIAKGDLNGANIMMVLGYSGLVGFIVLGTFLEIKHRKKSLETKAETSTLSKSSSSEPSSWTCTYCGNQNAANSKNCSQCGARK